MHARVDVESLDGVTVSPNNFIEGDYLVDYRISQDANGEAEALAFEFMLSDMTYISCGSLVDLDIQIDAMYELGACSVIPIGFQSGWVESDPPYLV
jgi:hypothetical protein